MTRVSKQWGDSLYKVVNLDSPEMWNHFLKCVPDSDIFYRPEYCQVFERERKEQGRLFVCETNEGNLVYPFFLRCINDLPCFAGKLNKKYYDVISPYGYSGPLSTCPPNAKAISFFHELWHKYCIENNIVSEFIRFHPLLENHLYPWNDDLKVEKAKQIVVVDLTLKENEIWSSYKYNNRKNISKAQRENLNVIIEENTDHLMDFKEIYYNTMERRQASSRYYFSQQFFDHITRYLPGNFAFAYVLKEKKVISAELLLFNERYIHSFLGGTLSEFFISRPNNLLKHQVILWAKAKGLKYFLLGGGYEENDGIFKYKYSFAPDGVRDFYVGKRVINQNIMSCLEELKERNGHIQHNKSDFFPSYREGTV